MKVGHKGHLTYCTNIHAGESWEAVFNSLKEYCLPVRDTLSAGKPFGIGLRLSGLSSIELLQRDNLSVFKAWLDDNGLYVFTLNGFPYGNFHGQTVKDNVHTPDWTTNERVDYTTRLFTILAGLLPHGMEGGISTSPLSYRYWHTAPDQLVQIKKLASENLVKVVAFLVGMQQSSGVKMHLDIEPEPDGILETSDEYIAFFENDLLKDGAALLATILQCSHGEARDYIRYHIQLCYDVCHFAVGFEAAQDVISKMEAHNLLIGKMQISAALRCRASENVPIALQQECLRTFDEPTYLHQAVVQINDGSLLRFRDLGAGVEEMNKPGFRELRAHFHVPVFTTGYMLLESTQNDITDALRIWCEKPFTQHLEVETYTWGILPPELQVSLAQSIERELAWVLLVINDEQQV